MADETESLETRVENMFAGDVEDDTSNVEEPEHDADELPEVEGDDEPDEPKDDEPKDESDEFLDVEYEGKLYSVPPELKDALLRTQDYTQKTQETAAQRKEVEVTIGQLKETEEKFNFAQSIQPDILKAQQLEAQAEQAHQYLRDNIDSLQATEIEKIRLAIEDSRRERDDLVQSLTSKQQEFQQAQEQSHAELLKQGTEVLRQKIPGWGEEQQKQVRDYALSNGFTEAEMSNVVDPRQVLTLWKASQYDTLQEGKSAAVKKVVATPTIKSQSRNPMPEDVKAKLNLRKELKNPKLSSRAKARKIQKAMGDRFG